MPNVTDHYKQLAADYGMSPMMSMKDQFTKKAEIYEITDAIYYHAKENPRVLEIGCGNGYTAEKVSKSLNISVEGIDFCKELIDIAKTRDCNCDFRVDDVLNLNWCGGTFDIVYTERCLINLLEQIMQEKALDEIYRVLKPDGIYIMIEAFTDGLHNLNQARKSVKLTAIPEPYHNKYFDKEWFLHYIKDKFKIKNTNQNFLSSYYWGSRVLYPAIIKGDPEYNTKFVEFFTFMQPLGNYSYIQCYVLEKKKARIKE